MCFALTGAELSAQVAAWLTTELIDARLTSLREGGAGDDDERILAYTAARGFLT